MDIGSTTKSNIDLMLQVFAKWKQMQVGMVNACPRFASTLYAPMLEC
jgi:hypothetical protein